ncbi:MAG: DUF1489 domain-containing protein [Pseudomonadota bacterium]
MTLHLIKLSVGSEGIEDLAVWQRTLAGRALALTGQERVWHTTRMIPKRRDELLDGGSIYWVIKRVVQVRQRIIGLEENIGEDGIKRCDIVLDPELIPTKGAARRPFQGWRYLQPDDAPPDLMGASGASAGDRPPPEMQRELAELCLL